MIDDLGTGDILARGETITGGDLAGPTKVRKRRSPDPREDTFEVPDTPPELNDVLSEIQDEVESDAQRREERKDELEQLRDRVETLEDEKAELEQELQDSERIAQALERIQQGGNGQESAEIAAELEELEERKQELTARVELVQTDKQQLQDELTEKEERIAELQQQYEDDLTALNSLRTAFQLMGLSGDGEAVEPVSEDQIERVVERKVEELDVGNAPQQTVGSVQNAILNEFQEEAVDRVMNKVDQMSDQQRTLLKFIEARDRTMGSMKQWAKTALGLDGNPNTTHYDNMRELVDLGFVRKNNDSSVAPNVSQMVEDELEGYDVDGDTVEETYQTVLSQLA